MSSTEVGSKPELKALQDKIGELPLLPQVLVSILQLNPDAND